MLGEVWDVYDAARRRTGAAARRGEPLPPGGYHLVVHVCLFSPDGRMLIQKRSREKRSWAGLWDLSSGGCALAGRRAPGPPRASSLRSWAWRPAPRWSAPP